MEKLTRENARKISFYGGKLEKCVEILIQYRERGESVVFDFNGHPLYSCDVTMDSAYLEVTGRTKAEFDEERRKWREECDKREKRETEEAERKKPIWLARGMKLIYPERIKDWKSYMDRSVKGDYHGIEIDATLEIMQKLEEGASMEEIEKLLKSQNHSGRSFSMVKQLVLYFSKRGPKFYENVSKGQLTEEEREVVERVKSENAELQRREDARNNRAQRTPDED